MKADDFQQPPVHYEPAKGFVFLLDALGARTLSGEDIDRFMEQHHFILQVLQEIMPWLDERRSQDRLTQAKGVPHVLVFGDTFAILWPAVSPHAYTFLRELQEFSAAISYVVALAFIAGLRLRGALAYGEFYCDTNIAIGPAIADAAEWYERAQLIGVVATPSTREVIGKALSDSIAPVPDPEECLGPHFQELLMPLRQDFVRLFWPVYNVPLRDQKSLAMMCLNWPYGLFLLGPDITTLTGEHVSSFFRRKLNSMPRPADAQAKYDYTASFYAFCVAYTVTIESHSFGLALERSMASDIPLSWFVSFFRRYGQS